MRNLLFRVLFVALCSNFVLCVPADDSDFIDEKGKALKNLRGEVKIIIPSHLNWIHLQVKSRLQTILLPSPFYLSTQESSFETLMSHSELVDDLLLTV